MLNFEEFRSYVENHVKEFLPETLNDALVRVNDVIKNNDQVMHGISISKERSAISPIVYLESYFEEYEKGKELDDVLKDIVKISEIHQVNPEELDNFKDAFLDFDKVKDKIVIELVNADANRENLKDKPYQRMEDLAITYKLVAAKIEDSTATVRITNAHLQMWGVTKEELHDMAIENSKRKMPAVVKPMSDIMKDIMMSDGMPEEIADMMVQETPVDKSMYVVTNADKIGGAATIVYSDALEKLSEQLGTDLIILPSSVHEVIALSAEGLAPEEMANMVVEVNENELLPEDKLSDHVYRYDAQAHTLKLADTTLEELEKENGRSIEQGEDLAVKPKRAR